MPRPGVANARRRTWRRWSRRSGFCRRRFGRARRVRWQAADLVLAGGRVVPAFGFGGAVVVCVFCGSGFRPKQCRRDRRSRGSGWGGWARARRVGRGPGRGGPAWRRQRGARRRWSGRLIGGGAAKGRRDGGGRSRKMLRGCDSRMAARGAFRFVDNRGKRTGGKARATWQGLSSPWRGDGNVRCAPARRFPLGVPPRADDRFEPAPTRLSLLAGGSTVGPPLSHPPPSLPPAR